MKKGVHMTKKSGFSSNDLLIVIAIASLVGIIFFAAAREVRSLSFQTQSTQVDGNDPSAQANVKEIFLASVTDQSNVTSHSLVINRPEGYAQEVKGNIVNYGNGVYYFPYTGALYGSVLSWFIGQHPDLELSSAVIVSYDDSNSLSVKHTGYFVTFRTKK